MLSLVVPSRNNLKYVKFAYNSIRTYLGPDVEVILLDDASTDGTWDWMCSLTDAHTKVYRNEGPDRVGHTILYDQGAKMASNEVFGIFHADMIATPNYVKNMMKHIKRGVVVSGTRIEPPLHPPGPEKYTADFGLEPEVFQMESFIFNVGQLEQANAGKTTKGVFAPWIMYKEDFFSIGGHDKRVFAPMELEDSDLFNRFLLAGFDMVQSRDAFVYHMTCRGSRYKDGVKIVQEIPLGNGQVWKRSSDSEEYTKLRQNKFREWWRKWHMDVLHNELMLPVVNPRYNIGFIPLNCPYPLITFIEPWCDTIYLPEQMVEAYIKEEQPHTLFDLRKRVKKNTDTCENDILVQFDATKFGQPHIDLIKQLPLMVKDSGELGIMEYDIFEIDIQSLRTYEDKLINADDPWYVNQLV